MASSSHQTGSRPNVKSCCVSLPADLHREMGDSTPDDRGSHAHSAEYACRLLQVWCRTNGISVEEDDVAPAPLSERRLTVGAGGEGLGR